jgi:uncharacterized protein (DUF433 family)
MKDYVVQIDEAYRITDSRVSLDSIVYAWRDGLSPESIRENFPVLTLEEVYGVITFYLANQAEVDTYLNQSEAKFEVARQQSLEQLRQHKPQLYARLVAHKQRKTPVTSVAEPVHP